MKRRSHYHWYQMTKDLSSTSISWSNWWIYHTLSEQHPCLRRRVRCLELTNLIAKHTLSLKKLVYFIGGLGEIGKNLQDGTDDIIVDAGIISERRPRGIDYAIPDYSYIVDNDRVKAVLDTDEDHRWDSAFPLRQAILSPGPLALAVEN